MKHIVLLGSTGSIGSQVVQVVRRHRSKFRIAGLAANANLAALMRQIREFRPSIVSVGDREKAAAVKAWCGKQRLRARVVWGKEGLKETASLPAADIVLSSVVGSVGIEPLLAAIESGKDIALANKEALVVAGELIMARAKAKGVSVLPVDSEHSAVFQCLKNEEARAVRRIILTASGGPFYRRAVPHGRITVKRALAHPTWRMGPKITIDSATLMNKGLEAIEAHHLFAVPYDRIDIVIHPQSIVHSMVEYADGSVLAQLSNPDMRLPIQFALTYPERCETGVRRLDLTAVRRLEFSAPDFRRFPCLGLALEAGRTGGTMPAVMNAANEVAVGYFLEGKIPFTAIAASIEKVMASHRVTGHPTLAAIRSADEESREKAREIIGGHFQK